MNLNNKTKKTLVVKKYKEILVHNYQYYCY